MGKNNFLLMSLEDDKAKKIANVMSNDSCRKILDYLTEKEGTESEISKELGIAISTVHYNLQQLLEVKLVDWENYHYSEKGKEVRHYKLASKYIIIAPKDDKSGFLDKLKTLFPTLLISLFATWLIYSWNDLFSSNAMVLSDSIAPKSEMMARGVEQESAIMAMDVSNTVAQSSGFLYSDAFWFLVGGITILTMYLIISWIIKKINKRLQR